MRQVVLKARSVSELEELQDRAIAMAEKEGAPVRCSQELRLKPNEKCLCGSGKKWKKCCMWEARTSVTFFPPNWDFDPPKRSNLNAAMAAIMLQGFARGGLIDA